MPERYQREIEEILQLEGTKLPRGPKKPGFWRLLWLLLKKSLGGKLFSVSPGRLMLTAGALLLSALIMRAVFPGIVGPLAWAGLLLFIIGYGMFFVRPPNSEKRWRGQVMDEPGESWWNRLRRKLRQ